MKNWKQFLAGIILLLLPAAPLCAQVIDLDADRQPIVSIAKDWRFHPGDDPRWSQPGFDDSGWKLIQPASDWKAQGYTQQNDMAWFRFRLRVPAKTSSIVVQIPRIDRSYQLFADGELVGQVGELPPASPRAVTGAARVYTLPVPTAASPREITLALRLWQAPRLVGISQNVLQGRALAGDPAVVLRLFATSKAAALLIQHGNEYTQDLIVLVMAAAGLLLFLLTREDFYLWFTLNMVAYMAGLPLRLAASHFAWGTLSTICLFILVDWLGSITFAIFLVRVLNLRGWRLIFFLLLLETVADLGPLLLIMDRIPLVWADGIYFVFIAAGEVILLWFLIRGWRRGMIDAKLLVIPYMLGVLSSQLGNLGHFLIDLHLSIGEKLLTANIELVQQPFSISLADVGNVLSLLGLLSVLVYRFARTSRDQQRLASALQAAHDIQHSLVPVDIPRLGGLHTEIVYLAAEEVGGDFCQVLPRADGSILVAIGDVSGKGLQAAMLGTLAVGALRSMADEDIEPAAALERLNQVILRTGNAGFITCLCLSLSPAGEVSLANAGHLAPYLNGAELPVAAGLPLGVIAEVEYEQSSFLLPETARLTLLSDGVVEARSRSGELFGFERTTKISQLPASQIAKAAHGHGQEDDITIITLDWRAPVLAV